VIYPPVAEGPLPPHIPGAGKEGGAWQAVAERRGQLLAVGRGAAVYLAGAAVFDPMKIITPKTPN